MIISNNIPLSSHSKEKITIKCDLCSNEYDRRYDQHIKSNKKQGKDVCFPCSRKLFGESIKGKRKLSDEHKKLLLEARRKKYPPLTKECKYCNKSFDVPYRNRHYIYCSRPCQGAAVNLGKSDIRTISKCQICDKEFKHYGERKFCSRECQGILLAKTRIGENNPNWIPRDNLEKSECPACGVIFSYVRSGLRKGQKRYFCSLKCCRATGSGKSIKNIKDYIRDANDYDKFLEYCSTPYPAIWNNKLKTKIKERDNFKCQLCGSDGKLEVHHIDYNKQNCEDYNLISLCRKCHNITNHNRQFWTQVFIGINSNSKIVRKGWGLEIHFVNNNKYCLKYLVFFKGKRFSWHKHNLKQELWFCSWGTFEAFIKKDNYEDYFLFKTGDKIEIMPGVEHQLKALTNCIITEVSTPDFPEDSIRLEAGD